jgi:hypothetical protein
MLIVSLPPKICAEPTVGLILRLYAVDYRLFIGISTRKTLRYVGFLFSQGPIRNFESKLKAGVSALCRSTPRAKAVQRFRRSNQIAPCTKVCFGAARLAMTSRSRSSRAEGEAIQGPQATDGSWHRSKSSETDPLAASPDSIPPGMESRTAFAALAPEGTEPGRWRGNVQRSTEPLRENEFPVLPEKFPVPAKKIPVLSRTGISPATL